MPQTPPTGSVPPSRQQPAHKTGAMPAVPPSGKTGVVPAVHPTGKTGPVPKVPPGPKQGIAKPIGPKPDLPDGTTFSDNPSDQPTVILHAEDVSGKNELVEKMMAAQRRAKDETPPHVARQALPTEIYQPPPVPASHSRPSTPVSNSKRIPMVNPHIAKLDEILRLYGTVMPQIAILELRKKDEWAHILPEEIKKSADFATELERQSKTIEAFYSHVRKLLTDSAYYTTMQANAEKMQQETAAQLELLAQKEAQLRAKESKMAGASGLTKSRYQQAVSEIEEERVAIAQEKANLEAARKAATEASEKLIAEKDAFERERKKFYTERDADTKMMTDLQGATERLGQREKAVQVLEEQVNKQMAALQADRKGLDEMVVAYQRDEEALRARVEELKEYNRQSEGIRASNESAGAALDNARKGYERKAQELDKRAADLEAKAAEMDKRKADFDVVAQKVLEDNSKLESDRAAYERDRAALDEQVKDIAEQRTTLDKGYKQIEQQEHALADKQKRLGEDIEKVVAQRIAESYKLVHEILRANKEYVDRMKSGSDELFRKITDFSSHVGTVKGLYASEDEKRKQTYEAALKKLNELTGGNKAGEQK